MVVSWLPGACYSEGHQNLPQKKVETSEGTGLELIGCFPFTLLARHLTVSNIKAGHMTKSNISILWETGKGNASSAMISSKSALCLLVPLPSHIYNGCRDNTNLGISSHILSSLPSLPHPSHIWFVSSLLPAPPPWSAVSDHYISSCDRQFSRGLDYVTTD